jgi:DNA-binding protein YbaB
MMNPFSQIGELKKMRDQAMAMQKKLQQIVVEVSKRGVYVKMSADQKIVDIKLNGKSDDDVKEAVNEALKKSQEAAAKELQQMTGGLGGLSSLLGGK